MEAHCINLVKLPQLVGGPEVYELRQSDSQIHVRNDCVVHLFRKWQMWWQCKCTAYISCYEKRDWLIAPTVVLLSSSHIILILHTPPMGCSHPMIEYGKATCMTLPMWIWAQGLLLAWPNRTATSLAKSLLDFCCSLRLFLPNSQSLPLFYYSCQTYITIWSLPSHSTASLSSKSCACATLFRYLLLCGPQLMQVVPRVVWENK